MVGRATMWLCLLECLANNLDWEYPLALGGYRLLYFLHSIRNKRLPACRCSFNPREGYPTVAPAGDLLD
ncbi:hypothetical protein T01_3779 [Trichinella spiralis]|uniref:Secreted protein n=1 Tax=Trichinella spiralis TaxID=6334 RepID=A0A0V0YTN1_TRISP|nr:hypothetical protein T01_3779 [Trichinella spiralis]